jgi:hypothetical protein
LDGVINFNSSKHGKPTGWDHDNKFAMIFYEAPLIISMRANKKNLSNRAVEMIIFLKISLVCIL